MNSRKPSNTMKSVLPSEKNGPDAAAAGLAISAASVGRISLFMALPFQLRVDRGIDLCLVLGSAKRGHDGNRGILGDNLDIGHGAFADLVDFGRCFCRLRCDFRI